MGDTDAILNYRPRFLQCLQGGFEGSMILAWGGLGLQACGDKETSQPERALTLDKGGFELAEMLPRVTLLRGVRHVDLLPAM